MSASKQPKSAKKAPSKDAKGGGERKAQPSAAPHGIEEIGSIPEIELSPAHLPFSDGIEPMPEFPVYLEEMTPVSKPAGGGKTARTNADAHVSGGETPSKTDALVENLSADSAVTLLKALYIRAEAGGAAAKDLEIVKRRLLS